MDIASRDLGLNIHLDKPDVSVGRCVVLLYVPVPEKTLDLLSQQAEVRLADSLYEGDLIQAVAEVDGFILRAYGKVSRCLIEAAPRLNVIGWHGVGVEAIDRHAALEMVAARLAMASKMARVAVLLNLKEVDTTVAIPEPMDGRWVDIFIELSGSPMVAQQAF